MSDDVSLRRERRVSGQSGNSVALWGLLIIAVAVAGVLGYLLRPMIDGRGVTSLNTNNPITSAGLSDLAKSQVTDAITAALTPLNSSVSELRQTVDSAGDVPLLSRHDVQLISDQLSSLRTYIDRQVGQMEQLVKTGDTEFRAGINQTILEINTRLAAVDTLSTSVKQLVTEYSELKNRIVTARPTMDEQDGASNVTQRPSQDQGSLLINNTTENEFQITVNGRQETLRPGRNRFTVPVENVVVAHPKSSLTWQLDATLWEQSEDGFVIRRKWSQ